MSSKTPLAKKLGIKPGFAIWAVNAPKDYLSFFDSWPEDVKLVGMPDNQIDFIHIFASTQTELENHLESAKPYLKMDGTLWISWPKKNSALSSDIDKFDVMQAGPTIGLVDVKVAAIDDDWSGHKFVYRLKDRNS